jgi:hypothetical protein
MSALGVIGGERHVIVMKVSCVARRRNWQSGRPVGETAESGLFQYRSAGELVRRRHWRPDEKRVVRFVVAIVFLPFCLDVAALSSTSLFADFSFAQGKLQEQNSRACRDYRSVSCGP